MWVEAAYTTTNTDGALQFQSKKVYKNESTNFPLGVWLTVAFAEDIVPDNRCRAWFRVDENRRFAAAKIAMIQEEFSFTEMTGWRHQT